jgi:hypothetical protein
MATYNCEDTTNSAYGAGSYGTCAQQVGAPNTGIFNELSNNQVFMIAAPIVVIVVVVAIVSMIIKRKHS